jgi:hypothetical protein
MKFLYDPVIPELDVACRRPVNTTGAHVHFKPTGRQSKAVFHFEVRGYSEARAFKERGVNQIVPAFRLKDCTDYPVRVQGDGGPLRRERDPVGRQFDARDADVRGDARCNMESAS